MTEFSGLPWKSRSFFLDVVLIVSAVVDNNVHYIICSCVLHNQPNITQVFALFLTPFWFPPTSEGTAVLLPP